MHVARDLLLAHERAHEPAPLPHAQHRRAHLGDPALQLQQVERRHDLPDQDVQVAAPAGAEDERAADDHPQVEVGAVGASPSSGRATCARMKRLGVMVCASESADETESLRCGERTGE